MLMMEMARGLTALSKREQEEMRMEEMKMVSGGEALGLLGLGCVHLAQLFISDIFHHFLAFFHIYSHFFGSLQNKIQLNKNLKIITITRIKQV